jgi:hypothetical protein
VLLLLLLLLLLLCWLHVNGEGCCGFWPGHKVEGGAEEAAEGMAQVAP